MENGSTSDSKDPSGFLSDIIGAPVTVKLNSSVVYKGRVFSKLRFVGIVPNCSSKGFSLAWTVI